MNPLKNLLQKNNKKTGLFNRTQTSPSYSTGFLPIDYMNGYILNAKNALDEVVARQKVLGMVGGSFVTIIGKSGVAKTSFAIQMASNIVRPFESGMVVHYDVEQATTSTRIKNLTKFTNAEMEDKYILKQDVTDIQDIYESIMQIHTEKTTNREAYEYDTGMLDEFGDKIIALQPTVILADSIPTITSRASSDATEMEGGTYSNRIAKDLSQFYKRMTPKIKQANIIFVAINHINAAISINPFDKKQPQLLYLKMDESMPGGNAPVYYANNVLKFVSRGRLTADKHYGFDGFKVAVEFLKSRTNKAGKQVTLIYNQDIGFDPVYTQHELLDELKMLGGKAPYRYTSLSPDVKFNPKNLREEFGSREEVQDAIIGDTLPYLESLISDVYGEQEQNMDVHNNILNAIVNVYENDSAHEFAPTPA